MKFMKSDGLFMHALVSFLVLSTYTARGEQAGYRIEITAPQWSGDHVFFCYHFNGGIYKKDSVWVAGDGKALLTGAETQPQGLYGVYADSDKSKFFEFLLADDQHFSLQVDTVDFPLRNQIDGAEQAEAFLSYTRFLSGKQKERLVLFEQVKNAPEDQQDALKEKISSLNDEVEHYMSDFLQRHKGEWVGAFFQGLQQVSGPFPSPTTQEEYDKEITYLRQHYFDYIDLADRRFWRTNYFPKKVDAYMRQVVAIHPDSLSEAASRLVARAEADSLCFQLMLTKLFNYGAESKIMGMENIWARLAEDYYFTGKASWVDTTYLKTLKTEYGKIQHNRIGMQIPDMVFTDMDGQAVQLYLIPADYTLLYFFEPGCGHCKKATPKIHDNLYRKFKTKGLEVLCVYTQTDQEEWKAFVDQHQLHDWINVWDPRRSTFFWQFFDVSVTPGIYLLDKEKKVIAKKLDEETLETFLSRLTDHK